jgi:drug/metabolite transporter (DMT)-like permease
MNFSQILVVLRQIITNPAVLSGIACQAIAFVTFISVLSWADISFVRPATALTYISSMVGAKFLLKEEFGRERLFGITLIGFGVVIHQ